MNAFSHIKYAAKTDVGRKRKNNEDAFGVFPDAGVFCVADGMGGGDDGEIASAAVVKSIGSFAMSHVPPPNVGYAAEDMATGVSMAVNEASSWIFSRAAERKLKGCGSTFVGICLDATAPSAALALHAGDSRLYRIRGSSIKQITRDHSAAEMIGAKDESTVNPCFRGVILRAVGVNPTVDVERTPLPLKEGDRIVICSDGLSKMIDDKTIAAIVHGGGSPAETADELIAAANKAGGADNVTVVVLFVGKLPLASPAISMVLPEASTDATEDVGEADTSDTGSGNCFGAETETADEPQTVVTVAANPQRPEMPVETRSGRMPLKSPTASAPRSGGRRRALRIVAAVLVVAVFMALAVLCSLQIAQRAKARTAAAEAERQRRVQVLAATNADAETEAAKRRAESSQPKTEAPPAAVGERESDQRIGKVAAISEEKPVEELKETAKDAAANARELEALAAFARSCAPTNSEVFVRTVRRFPNKGGVESLQMRFRPMCDATLPAERRLAIATAITADVKDIAKALRKYSERRMAQIASALAEHMTRPEFKKNLEIEREGLSEFMSATEKFVEMDESSPEAHEACADVMLGVAKWFRQVN